MKWNLILIQVFMVDNIAMQVAHLCWGHQVPSFWTRCPEYHSFLVLREKDTVMFEHSISDARKNFDDQWVRAAINKWCVGNAADAICCLLPWATLDDIIKKFQWLYRSMESFDNQMQEFYQIVQGKSERVQTFVLQLEWALNVIKQQHPHAMTEDEGVKHLKDQLLHGLKPNIHNTLHYMCSTPDLQYSQLVMAVKKAETETPGSNVSEGRAKSAVIEIDSKSKRASSDPFYEVITQQNAYLMSAITNQKTTNNSVRHNNWDGKIPKTKTQRPDKDRKDMNCWGVEVLDMGGGNMQLVDKTILSLLTGNLQSLPALTREESTSMDN